jgi:hypothetical protein
MLWSGGGCHYGVIGGVPKNYSQADDKFFQQKEGMAMGSYL